ncbi:MAG: asparagine synthase (glutamine-hydrolyzing) [Pedobacter sp.]|nr:MAG: asparagine synthase (glutamine-hydrolyzing) [Pedobacter sp.]
MCGIYITNIAYEKNEVTSKLGSIGFRGPDNTGYKIIDGISFGHLRLSIIDLDQRSNQPYLFEDFTIVFNGEIYNFKDIRQELIELGYNFDTTSDTEVLIKGYKEWGEHVVPKLNGMFAFVIYHNKSETVFCARDRLGVKPFYYYWKDGKFEICSQLRPLINSKSKVSEEAVSIFLDCGYVPSPYSIIEDVYKLPPGNYMVIDLKSQSKNLTTYWDLESVETLKLSYEDAKENLHDLLKDAVKIRMQSDVALGSFLSGGVDSALVSAISQKMSEKPINTFTIGFDDPKYDESKIAGKFAEIIGSNHRETICGQKDALAQIPTLVKVFDEPFADSSALPSLLLNSITKKYVTVALSGDGGDESFLGYNHFDYLRRFESFARIPYSMRRFLAFFYHENLFKYRADGINSLLKTKSSDDYAKGTFLGFDTLQVKKRNKWFGFYNKFKKSASTSIQRMADLNIKLWLENDSNVKVDRASMAYSVEVRSPFLDYRVVEFARKLPVSFRYGNGVKKKIIRDILSEYIPESVFDQPKQGFAIPLGKWIKEDLKSEIEAELNDAFLSSVPNLDVKKFKKQRETHFSGKSDYTFNIWKLYILARWLKEFNLKF